MTGPTPRPEPFFLDGGQGRLFAIYFPPADAPKAAVLYLPPFAEEMNRCRAAVAEQARRFALLGIATLVLDLFGTGESEGEFADASWARWLDDADRAARWLEQRCGKPVWLWGFRLGALLAANLAAQAPGRFRRLLFWQPILDGKLFLTQYLRLRVAWLMDRGLPAETTESIRQGMQSGGCVEVAGYRLAGPIVEDIDDKRMADLTGLRDVEIAWFEQVAEAGKVVMPASQKAIERLREQACLVDVRTFIGAPIWQLHDRDQVLMLLDLTSDYFREPA